MQSPTASPRAPTSPASAPTSPNSHTSSSELTPRSKVRALLQLDDDSDFDSPLKPLSVSKSRKSASPRSVRKSPSDQFTKSKSDASDDSNSESDAAPRKPVGRIVARLHGHNAMNKQTQRTKPSTHESTVESEEDDDEDIPVSKQLKQRKRPSASALSTPSKSASDSIGSAASSPGLFVSPGPANVSMSDDDRLPVVNLASKLRALAQNSEQAEKPPQQSAKSKKSKSKKARHSPLNSDEIDKLATSENEDADVEDRLTQQTRTSRRKASKKALEEMNRETQRMARNQQLAHQAKVRRKFTKADLFKKFNFNPETGTIAETSSPEKPSQRVAADKSSEDELYMMSGALVSSDVETSKRKDTPPTSPVHIGNTPKKSMVEIQPADEAEIPSKDKSTTALATKNPRVTRQFRVILPQTTHVMLDDSDDELEIVKPNKALALLDHLPVNKNGEDSSLLRLRHLANLTSPGKKRKNGSSMNAAELQAQLREKARQQAINEKEERIADLRAKGIHVQTYEEREKEQLELENLLEKARVDAVDIAKKEKAAAKKAGVDVDAHDILDDDEDDDDWDGEDEAEQSDAELALSGSEDEEDGEVDDDEGEGVNNMPLFDNEADESDGDDIGENIEEVFSIFKKKPSTANDKLSENSVTSDINQIAGQFHQAVTGAHTAVEETVQSDSDSGPVKAAPRHSRKRMVVEDDDDEDNDLEKPTSTASQRSAGDETRVAFGFKSQAPAFGLSQLLDSTLAGADSQDLSQVFDPEEDSLALLRDLPDGTAPQFSTPSFRHGLVPDSQRVEVDKATLAPFTQINLGISQFPDFPSTDADMSPTKMSEMIEPTQDAGFAVPRMPIGGLGGPSSTVDTVMIDAQQETPVAKTKGRLVRKTEAIAELSEEETDDEYSDGAQEVDHGKDVFNVLFNGAKKSAAKAEFNKKKSAAKELVEDQAEESEDEYAGLGGASDDESNGEVDEEMLKMMDDGHVDVNERAVIALHADKQRQEDEKRLNQLYKDITTGGLRRKRGAAGMDDLSDHEDDAAERRRRKQEEFAKMRRALLADEKIGKIAQNPKQQAFFLAIEDREEFNGLEYMDRPEQESVSESQVEEIMEPREAAEESDASQTSAALKRKLPHGFEEAVGKENVPPRNPRRTYPDDSSKRPTTLAEIRESLSFFLEDSIVPDSQIEQSDEEDDLDFGRPFSVTRSDTNTSNDSMSSRTSVVNRLARTDSQDSLTSKHLAFQAGSSATGPSFKVPSLLRRATNLSATSNSSTRTSNSSGSNESSVRMGGSKKSNIHYQAREAERRRVVDAADQKRKAQVKKTVMSSKGRSILGLLRKGDSGFE